MILPSLSSRCGWLLHKSFINPTLNQNICINTYMNCLYWKHLSHVSTSQIRKCWNSIFRLASKSMWWEKGWGWWPSHGSKTRLWAVLTRPSQMRLGAFGQNNVTHFARSSIKLNQFIQLDALRSPSPSWQQPLHHHHLCAVIKQLIKPFLWSWLPLLQSTSISSPPWLSWKQFDVSKLTWWSQQGQ